MQLTVRLAIYTGCPHLYLPSDPSPPSESARDNSTVDQFRDEETSVVTLKMVEMFVGLLSILCDRALLI
jgi:hypothetical protein